MVEVKGNGNTTSKSPFKSIKRVLKFNKQHDRSATCQSIPKLEYTSHLKSRGSSMEVKTGNRSHSTKTSNNRKSAQRISLFYCDNVKVLNATLSTPNPTLQDFRYTSTSLLAMGPLEIYEIKTNSSCSKYLTIGKNSDIVHPLLPKLKVTKLIIHENSEEINRYYISFSNPSRFWEIQFPQDDSIKNDIFESVISKSCRLIYLEDKYKIEKEFSNVITEDDSKTINNDSIDDLNYLLEDSDSDNDDISITKTIMDSDKNKKANNSTYYPNKSSKLLSNSNDINQQFRKVIEEMSPFTEKVESHNKWVWKQSNHQNLAPSEKNNKKMAYKRSLYVSNPNILLDIGSIKTNRRSVSGLSDYDTLVSLHNLRI